MAIMVTLLELVASILVRAGMTLSTPCSAARSPRAQEVAHRISTLNEHTKYPLDALPIPLQIFMTALPFAFTGFYPVAFALRPIDHWMPGTLSLPVGVLTAAVGFVILRLALRKYQSVGSVDV